MSAKRGCFKKWILPALIVLFAVYSALYIRQFFKVNRIKSREYVKALELPAECRSGLEIYDSEDMATIGVWVMRCDIDTDGIDELITDAGDIGRGAANSWYNIWKLQPSGKYVSIGEYFCDERLLIPGIGIYGMPGIFCIDSTWHHNEWVPWRNGRYSGKGSY